MPAFAHAEVARLLAEPDFRRVWSVGALAGIGRWLELLAIGIFTFDVTGSPFLVALMTFLRTLPMALFGAFFGALAERMALRTVLLFGMAVLTAASAVLFALAGSGQIEVWHLAVGAFVSGVIWATDPPVRRNLMGVIAGSERAGQAMSLDAATGSITRALGPAIGGLLLAILGLSGAIGLTVVLYGASVVLMYRVSTMDAPTRERPSGLWRDLREGLALVGQDRAIIGALAITIVYNAWAFPFVSMIPVIGREDLALGSFAVGLLASAEGVGAFLGAMTVALAARPAHFRHIYYFGTGVCLVMVLAFAVSGHPAWSGIAILISGIGAGCFSSMQSTIIFLSAPLEARGRLLGLLAVCIGAGPIGFVHLGWMANIFGAATATTIMAIEGLVVLLLLALFLPVLRPLQIGPTSPTSA